MFGTKNVVYDQNNWAELEQQAAYMRVRVFWPGFDGFDRAGEIKKEKKILKSDVTLKRSLRNLE